MDLLFKIFGRNVDVLLLLYKLGLILFSGINRLVKAPVLLEGCILAFQITDKKQYLSRNKHNKLITSFFKARGDERFIFALETARAGNNGFSV